MRYETFDVAVPGGDLRVGRWGSGPEVVLAAHGLTGTHRHFAALADQLGDEVTLLAPDLRGRGGSWGIAGPYGMAAHAADLVAVLDHVGAADATVVGHSMGGFVAVVAADLHPGRVREVVLVDGGLPLDLTGLTGLSVDQVVEAITGPALARLRLRFPSAEEYLDRWRAHPALAAEWNDYVEGAYRYELVGEPPELSCAVREDAVLADAGSELRSGDVERALARFGQPVVLVRAPRGIFDQVPPLYPDSAAADRRATLPRLTELLVPDVNHYTILLTERGAGAVASVLRERAVLR